MVCTCTENIIILTDCLKLHLLITFPSSKTCHERSSLLTMCFCPSCECITHVFFYNLHAWWFKVNSKNHNHRVYKGNCFCSFLTVSLKWKYSRAESMIFLEEICCEQDLLQVMIPLSTQRSGTCVSSSPPSSPCHFYIHSIP